MALPGQRLFMDFVDLPTGADFRGNLHDCGLVVRDGATECIWIMPCAKEIDAQETAQLLLDWVFPAVGFPNAIFSDRDVRFAAKVWLALAALLGVDLRKSTANHPQTDGGGESAVKDIVTSLRLWANLMGSNWVRNRAMLQMAINTRPGDTRGGKTAYDQMMGFTPRITSTVSWSASGSRQLQSPRTASPSCSPHGRRPTMPCTRPQSSHSTGPTANPFQFPSVTSSWCTASHSRTPRITPIALTNSVYCVGGPSP